MEHRISSNIKVKINNEAAYIEISFVSPSSAFPIIDQDSYHPEELQGALETFAKHLESSVKIKSLCFIGECTVETQLFFLQRLFNSHQRYNLENLTVIFRLLEINNESNNTETNSCLRLMTLLNLFVLGDITIMVQNYTQAYAIREKMLYNLVKYLTKDDLAFYHPKKITIDIDGDTNPDIIKLMLIFAKRNYPHINLTLKGRFLVTALRSKQLPFITHIDRYITLLKNWVLLDNVTFNTNENESLHQDFSKTFAQIHAKQIFKVKLFRTYASLAYNFLTLKSSNFGLQYLAEKLNLELAGDLNTIYKFLIHNKAKFSARFKPQLTKNLACGLLAIIKAPQFIKSQLMLPASNNFYLILSAILNNDDDLNIDNLIEKLFVQIMHIGTHENLAQRILNVDQYTKSTSTPAELIFSKALFSAEVGNTRQLESRENRAQELGIASSNIAGTKPFAS